MQGVVRHARNFILYPLFFWAFALLLHGSMVATTEVSNHCLDRYLGVSKGLRQKPIHNPMGTRATVRVGAHLNMVRYNRYVSQLTDSTTSTLKLPNTRLGGPESYFVHIGLFLSSPKNIINKQMNNCISLRRRSSNTVIN